MKMTRKQIDFEMMRAERDSLREAGQEMARAADAAIQAYWDDKMRAVHARTLDRALESWRKVAGTSGEGER